VKALRIAVGLLAALLAVPTSALAWNNHGHMLIAAVAWSELTPTAKARVSQLLTRNPDYGAWTAGVPEADKGRIAFLKASTWPDAIRSAPGYAKDDITTSGARASQNIGYADHLVHPYWHYRDEPFSTDGSALAPPETPNASTQIEAFTAALRSNASDDVKSYDLAWLEHLVGDVHQPLHAVSRFTHDAPAGDRGGNSVHLCDDRGCAYPLHSFWDAALGRSEDPASVVAEAAALPRAPDAQAHIADDRVWLEESAALARQVVYAAPIGPGVGPYTPTPAYIEKARRVSRDRAALAGRRLAALINANLR
jgi:hypothetical protein